MTLLSYITFFPKQTKWQPFCSFQESMDNITLFSIITIMSFFLLAPVTVFMDGIKFTPAYLESAVSTLVVKFIWNCCCSCYQKTSSSALSTNMYWDHLSWQGLNMRQVYIRSLLAALCFHAYQQVSFLLLCITVPFCLATVRFEH